MNKIKNYTLEDMAWTLINFYPDLNNDIGSDEKLLTAMRAIMIVAQRGCGDCMSVDSFISAVDDGYFTPYDGSGYFCDEDGNKIEEFWDTHEIPENAKFVMWFNK